MSRHRSTSSTSSSSTSDIILGLDECRGHASLAMARAARRPAYRRTASHVDSALWPVSSLSVVVCNSTRVVLSHVKDK